MREQSSRSGIAKFSEASGYQHGQLPSAGSDLGFLVGCDGSIVNFTTAYGDANKKAAQLDSNCF